MTNIHSHPTPLRQKFIEYLTLNRKAERTVRRTIEDWWYDYQQGGFAALTPTP